MGNSTAVRPPERTLKLFSVFTGFFVASLLLANVTAGKIFEIGPFALSAGVIVFPVAFIFGDILTEVYGYELSRKVIWTGFGCQILAAVIYLIVGFLPPASFWPNQVAYDQILGFVPRIVLASIAAYFCGEFCNSFVLSKMKYWAEGKRGLRQAWRFIASTVVGEAVDTLVVVTIAFAGVYEIGQLVQIGVSVYIFKVLFEIVATPISLPFSNWVKRIEGVDVIDTPEKTSYSPFGFSKGDAA
ncbi:MAG: queuosine precursor transporter [Acidobacteria bacterium]|nr:queuosine precursor transporter [Acidobacteriota bacterium]